MLRQAQHKFTIFDLRFTIGGRVATILNFVAYRDQIFD